MWKIPHALLWAAALSIARAVPRTYRVRLLIVAAMTAIPLPAFAQVAITDAWVRGTVAAQRATGAFMQLTSPTDTALVAVTTPVAKIAEVHEMKLEGGVMKMNAVDRLALPAGKAVELKPGSYHVMLMELAGPLKEGETVPLTLTFEDKSGRKSTVDVKAEVRSLTASGAATRK